MEALQQELDQGLKSRQELGAELSSKEDRLAELEKALQAAQSGQAKRIGMNSIRSATRMRICRGSFRIWARKKRLRKAGSASSNRKMRRLPRSRSSSKRRGIGCRRSSLHYLQKESEIAAKDQALAQSAAQLEALQQELDQGLKSQEELGAELSSKKARLAELEKALQEAQSGQPRRRMNCEIRNENADLQAQLSDLGREKATFESRLAQLESQNAALAAELEQLNGTQDRLSELESA